MVEQFKSKSYLYPMIAAIMIMSVAEASNADFLSCKSFFQESLELHSQIVPQRGFFVYSPFGVDLAVYLYNVTLQNSNSELFFASYFHHLDFLEMYDSVVNCLLPRSTLQVFAYGFVNSNTFFSSPLRYASDVEGDSQYARKMPYESGDEVIKVGASYDPFNDYRSLLNDFLKARQPSSRFIRLYNDENVEIVKESVNAKVANMTFGAIKNFTSKIDNASQVTFITGVYLKLRLPHSAKRYKDDVRPFNGLNELGILMQQKEVNYLRLRDSMNIFVEVRLDSNFCYDIITMRFKDKRFSLNLLVPKIAELVFSCFAAMGDVSFAPNKLFQKLPLCNSKTCFHEIIFPEFIADEKLVQLELSQALKMAALYYEYNNVSMLSLLHNHPVAISNVQHLFLDLWELEDERDGSESSHLVGCIGTRSTRTDSEKKVNTRYIDRPFMFQIRFNESSTAPVSDGIVLIQGKVVNIAATRS